MAHVHVHVRTAKHRARPGERTLHWMDRAVLGMVMSIAAFVIERAVIRGTKKKAPDDAAGAV